MGLCRSLNLLLGMSLLIQFDYWLIALTPLVYIGAITMISQGEVHGNNKKYRLCGFAIFYSITWYCWSNYFWDLQILQALPFYWYLPF